MSRKNRSNYTTEMTLLRKQMKPTVQTKNNNLTTRNRWENIAYNAKISEHMDALKNKHATLMTVKQDIKSIEKLFNCKSLHDVPNLLKKNYVKKSEIANYINDSKSSNNKSTQHETDNQSDTYTQSNNPNPPIIPNIQRNNSDNK